MKKSVSLRIAIVLLFVSSAVYANDNLQLMLDSVKSGTILYVGTNNFISERAYKLNNKHDVIIVFNDSCNIYCSSQIENVFEIENCNHIQIINGKFKHQLAEETGCTGSVFRISDSKNISIINCNINGSGARGVYASSTGRLTIESCHLHHNSESAYYFSENCKSIYLTGNILNDNGQSGNVAFELESYTAPEREIVVSEYNPEEKTEHDLMLLTYKKVLATVSDGSYTSTINPNAPPKVGINDITTHIYPAQVFNNSHKGYRDELWLVPTDNLIDYYMEKSKLRSFDVEIASKFTNLSESAINSISPKAIVNSVESNELYMDESYTVGLSFYKIPELDSILSELRGKNQIIIAAQRDKFINEIIKVHRKYIIANTMYQNTKFGVRTEVLFNINNYDINNQILNLHIFLNCITESYMMERIYIATARVYLPLDVAQHFFDVNEWYYEPIQLKVAPGFSRIGLGISGGGLNRWEIPNMEVLEDPTLTLNFDGKKTNIQIIGLKGVLFPGNINTERWDLHTRIENSPWPANIRYIDAKVW